MKQNRLDLFYKNSGMLTMKNSILKALISLNQNLKTIYAVHVFQLDWSLVLGQGKIRQQRQEINWGEEVTASLTYTHLHQHSHKMYK